MQTSAFNTICIGLVLAMCCIHTTLAQKNKGDLLLQGVTYSDPNDRYSIHKNFTLNYAVHPGIIVQVHGFRHRFMSEEIFGGHFATVGYITDKLYAFSGARTEFMMNLEGKFSFTNLELINGIGYDVNENFSMEMQQDIGLLDGLFGTFSNRSDFSVKGTLKF